jgi:Bacterial Ig-like domain (group 2)
MGHEQDIWAARALQFIRNGGYTPIQATVTLKHHGVDKILAIFDKGEKALEELVREARLIEEDLKAIEGELASKALSATLTIQNEKGVRLMPATLQVGQTANAVWQEFSGPNGTGSPLAPASPPTFTSSDPTIATVDPSSGLVTAIAPGTATITGTDPGNGLTASDTVSDTPLVAQSATLVVTPTAAAPAVKKA